jgi:hypothetical protein
MEKPTLNTNDENHVYNANSGFLLDGSETGHQLWREMQTFYQAYVLSSEALAASTCDPQFCASFPADQGSRIAILSNEQRTAFENYVDARLRYSEFHRDQDGVRSGVLETLFHERDLERRPGTSLLARMLSLATNLVLIATVVSGSIYYAREQRRIHELTVDREQIRARLAQMEGDLNAATRRLDTGRPFVAQPSVVSANPPQVFEKSMDPSGRTGKVGNAGTTSASARMSARSRYDFRLPFSKQFQEVGQVRVSIRSVDPKQKSLDVWVITGSKIERKRVRLNVPVPITQANGGPRISLVATRVEGKYVHGYLLQPVYKRIDTTAHRTRVPVTARAAG